MGVCRLATNKITGRQHEDEVEDETEDVDDVVAASRANNQKFSQNPLGELAANPFGDFQDKTSEQCLP